MLEDRQLRRVSLLQRVACPRLGLDRRFSIFEEQCEDFTQVRVQLIKRFGLRMRSRKSRDEADEETSFRRPFDNSSVGLHVFPVLFFLRSSGSPRETVLFLINREGQLPSLPYPPEFCGDRCGVLLLGAKGGGESE
jgi:hypothetical protein